MNSLAKILLPIDFSVRVSLAVHYVRELARPLGSELILTHVLPSLHSEFQAAQVAGSMMLDVFRVRTEQAERELAGFERQALEGLHVRRMVLHGDPATKIVELARDEQVDLIAM